MRIFQVVEVLLLFLIPIMHRAQTEHCRAWEMPWQILYQTSGVARNLIWGMGVYFLISHCNFKTSVNVPHVNKTVTNFFGVYIPIYPPSLRLCDRRKSESINYQQRSIYQANQCHILLLIYLPSTYKYSGRVFYLFIFVYIIK